MPIISSLNVMHPEVIEEQTPAAKGVYALYNHNEDLIYYGFSIDSIRNSLLSHLSDEEECLKKAWYFNYEETDYPIKRNRLLLLEYIRTHKRTPPCNKIEEEEDRLI